MDDASTDESVRILQEYAVKYQDKVSQFIINNHNSGSTFKQWKKGVELAGGEYVWIAESDDVAEATFLEKLVPVLDQKESLNVAICNINQINENGDLLERRTEYPAQELFPPSVLREKFSNGNYIFNASAAVFRKSALAEVNWNLIQGFTFTGDWLFWCMLLKNSGLGVFPETLCYHRYHENNVSNNAYKRGLFFEEGLAVYEWIRDNVGITDEIPVYIRWKNKLSKSGFDADLRTKLVKRLKAAFPKWWILDFKHAVSKQKKRFRRHLLLQQRSPAA